MATRVRIFQLSSIGNGYRKEQLHFSGCLSEPLEIGGKIYDSNSVTYSTEIEEMISSGRRCLFVVSGGYIYLSCEE